MTNISLLSPTVYNRIRNHLHEFTILEHSPVMTCDDVHHILHVPFDQIVKCLVLQAGNFPVLVAVPGNRRVDIKAVETLLDHKGLHVASRAEAEKITRLPLGAISPLGLAEHIPIVIDSNIVRQDRVYFGTGNNESSLAGPGRLLAELTSAIVAPIAK